MAQIDSPGLLNDPLYPPPKPGGTSFYAAVPPQFTGQTMRAAAVGPDANGLKVPGSRLDPMGRPSSSEGLLNQGVHPFMQSADRFITPFQPAVASAMAGPYAGV